MSKDEIINKAVYIQYPINFNSYNSSYKKENIIKLPLPKKNEMYTGWSKNSNHFTTEYHRLYSLPTLNKLLNFNFNINHFNLKHQTCNNFDISMLYPKNNFKFEIYGYSRNEHFDDLTYDDLMKNNSKGSDITEYHRLYKYGHECSRVINKSTNNGKLLFISGDSQMIPDIPVLCCYYKEVWYFDNRYRVKLCDKFKDINFDQVLIQLNNNSITKYLNENFY